MAPQRRPRDPQLLDTDSDCETDTERTPQSPRHLKKRVSDVYNPDADHSFSSAAGRVPLRTVSINDDAAEKRRRRMSFKVAALEKAGPSSDGNIDPTNLSRTARQKQQLKSVAQPPVINVPLDVMSSNFEEWMKMATDNKINAANSWNFALIDYFHDMQLLRNNTDNSINFQRASCTLDGCVKIWTSRVDSVGTETGKLLSNLASEGKGDGDDEPTSDNPDAQDPAQAKKKKSHRAEATLAKNPNQLRNKKLDLEFSVDPLFKKTCADFDEGGAQGLLMNHLSLGVGSDGGMRVVFDASDSMGKVADEEQTDEPEDDVDLSHLRKEFLPDLTMLERKAISHSLSSFSFNGFGFDDAPFYKEDHHAWNNDGTSDPSIAHDDNLFGDTEGDAPPVEDFFQGEQGIGYDYGAGPDDYGGDNGSNESMGDEDRQGQGGPGVFPPSDARRVPNERDLVMAMTEGDGDGGMMDYFDQNFLKNWAGPEHWKLRKVIRRPDAAENKAAKAPREKKEAFTVDFLSPPEKDIKEIAKDLFAPVTRGAGINLPGTGAANSKSRKNKRTKEKEKEKRDDHRLPDDMHFSSRKLVTLFLKPKFSLRMRGQRVRFNPGDGEVDENFWAQAAADQAAGRGREEEGDETNNSGAIPFNTQFFHDDYDDAPGFDDVYEGEGNGANAGVPDADAGEQDLLAATQGQTRRVRPEFVNYAKRAKRVDVRKLKENIWEGLNIVIPPPQDERMDVDNPPPEPDESEARVFASVIEGLQKSYPRDKMEEISTSFCFICLLHLANERGLKLEGLMGDGLETETMEDLEDGGSAAGDKIGNIWDLKVYRDPYATPAA